MHTLQLEFVGVSADVEQRFKDALEAAEKDSSVEMDHGKGLKVVVTDSKNFDQVLGNEDQREAIVVIGSSQGQSIPDSQGVKIVQMKQDVALEQIKNTLVRIADGGRMLSG